MMDLRALSSQWQLDPPSTFIAARQFLAQATEQAALSPAIHDESCSVVYCSVINECNDDHQRALVIREVYRVLRRGGVARFYVDVTDEQKQSMLLNEAGLSDVFARTGYYGIRVVHRSHWPISVEQGVETRSYVFEAFRGKDGPCLDCRQAVIYKGPWKRVFDDDGHVFERDVRTAVCEKTFRILTNAPYASHVFPVEPYVATPLSEAPPFSCRPSLRTPDETKALSPQAAPKGQTSCCDD
jgi:hypothetical protein